MGYQHINNLYKDQTILLFRECWALEKIHGTSANIRWGNKKIHLSSGGESHERFRGIFDLSSLEEKFLSIGHSSITIYGEAYGGKQQKQGWRYGPNLRFAAFDVQIEDFWLNIPDAFDIVQKLGLEFVHFDRTSTDIEALNTLRDAPSVQARRNGVDGDKPREGIVLRPIIEMCLKNGDRICAKHKRDDERETNKTRKVVDPAQLEVLVEADSIALEWATETRLAHVLDKLPQNINIENTKTVIEAMMEDVLREGKEELVDSKEARKAIGKRTAILFKEHLNKKIV